MCSLHLSQEAFGPLLRTSNPKHTTSLHHYIDCTENNVFLYKTTRNTPRAEQNHRVESGVHEKEEETFDDHCCQPYAQLDFFQKCHGLGMTATGRHHSTQCTALESTPWTQTNTAHAYSSGSDSSSPGNNPQANQRFFTTVPQSVRRHIDASCSLQEQCPLLCRMYERWSCTGQTT